MRNKFIYILALSSLILSEPVFAVSRQSENALNAFRRYEPEFSSTLRSLQELNRKQLNEGEISSDFSEVLLKAEKLMSKVDDRYDLMEDLFNNTLSRNPADQTELREGFNRLDDLYRKVRDYYADNYAYRDESKETKDEGIKEVETETSVIEAKSEFSYELNPLSASDENANIISSEDQDLEEKVKLTGSLKFEFRDSDEKHENVGGVTIPNDMTSGRLRLTYDIDSTRQLYLEEKYLTRERNEKIKENHFTLAFMKKNSDDSALTFRDKLQHVWYPDDSNKNYRINLFEALYAKNWKDKDLQFGVGVKTKTYPRNSRSDYNEYIISGQESWNQHDTNIYIEFVNEIVKHKNVSNLDYKNVNLYTELNKSFSGNKAELVLANTYDRRLYDDESLIAFRTSYYDDLFHLSYDLPVNDKVTYRLKGDYTKRNYTSDEPRGYSETDIFNGFTIMTDDRTYISADYRYVYNDENTREFAHKNNFFHVGWLRNINKDYKIKFENTYHQRNSVTNNALDFDENNFIADLSWVLNKNYKLSWVTEHFIRRYDNISMNFTDYRYLESGFNLSFYKRRSYDWKIIQKWRKMEFRNLAGVPSGWTDRIQPVSEISYNRWLKEDLKLSINGLLEKTYYSEFNNASQELEYNFADKVYNKQIYASLEYMF